MPFQHRWEGVRALPTATVTERTGMLDSPSRGACAGGRGIRFARSFESDINGPNTAERADVKPLPRGFGGACLRLSQERSLLLV